MTQPPAVSGPQVDFREQWERFRAQFEGEMPSDDADLLDTLTVGLGLARDEWGGAVSITVRRLDIEDVPAIDAAPAVDRAEAMRAAIRDAAAREFADKGYAAATVADIARTCGVSKAMM